VAVVGALVTTVPLAVGVASGHRVLGLFCALGGLNVALALPSGTRVTRRRWGVVTLLGSAAGVALATAVSASLWLSVLVTLVWVATWCLVRGIGVPAVGVGFVTCAVFIIVAGQPARLGDVLPRTAAYVVGGAVALALCVAVVRPTGGATTPARMVPPGALMGLATTSGIARQHAVRASVMVASATLLYRVLHVPNGYWIPLAVIAVLQPDATSGRTRALQRALGTLVGVVVAAAVIALTRSDAVLLVCVLVTSGGLFALKARNYFWMVALLTPLVLLMLTVVSYTGLRIIGYRVVDTLVGTALALVVVEIWDRGEATGTPGASPPS
ncbi:MAG TPA: FUSC family protein, partial [Acidimicrobiales bacterium]